MEEKVLNTALENFKLNTGLKFQYTATNKNGLDGKLELFFKSGTEVFEVEVRSEIREHQLSKIMETARGYRNYLLIANTIFPKIKEALRNDGIGYLDSAGNIFLKTEKHHLWIDGHKIQPQKEEKIYRAFKATGLKLIFLLLKNENILNMPQRAMAEKAGIALGNVNYILSGLKEYNFLIQKEKGTLQIINKQELLQKWITSYDEILKPKLHLANFRFANLEAERNWMQLNLNYETCWGGEPAGAIITKYLNPEIFTLYTGENRNQLIKNYHLIPDRDGNIKVFRKFWKDNDEINVDNVHPIIVYADLVNTGSDRCLETAKIIYDKYIK